MRPNQDRQGRARNGALGRRLRAISVVLAACAGASLAHAQTAAEPRQTITFEELQRALGASGQPAPTPAPAPGPRRPPPQLLPETRVPAAPGPVADQNVPLQRPRSFSFDDLRQAVSAGRTPAAASASARRTPRLELNNIAVRSQDPVLPAVLPASLPSVGPRFAAPAPGLGGGEAAGACRVMQGPQPAGAWRTGAERPGTFYFTVGSYAITPEAANFIMKQREILRRFAASGDRIMAVGNADTSGNAQANVVLSLKRAQNLKACLVELGGLPEANIMVAGYGVYSPVRMPQTVDPAGNRRVDLMLLSEYQRRLDLSFVSPSR